MAHLEEFNLKLFSPLSGYLLPIEQVPDPVFSQKLVGDGLAIDPTDNILYAPCTGQIIQLHPSQHAVTIKTLDGFEILLHIGIDTVKLKGQGFSAHVKIGDQVKIGQKLIDFDLDYIAQNAKSLLSLMIIAGGPKSSPLQFPKVNIVRAKIDSILEARFTANATAKQQSSTSSIHSQVIKVHLPTGLHARPAALITNLAQKFTSDISVVKNAKTANAKSVVALLSLEILKGDEIFFRASGSDAQKSVDELSAFFMQIHEKEEVLTSSSQTTSQRKSVNSNVFLGAAASPGLVVGRLHQIQENKIVVNEFSKDASLEKRQLLSALKKASQDLAHLESQLIAEHKASQASVFAAHQELLKDPELLALAEDFIQKKKSAAFSWQKSISFHADRLAQLKNELLANRANDLRDVGQRVLRILTNESLTELNIAADSILVADNLSPSDIVNFSKSQILGFCTTTGGPTSHVSILARSFGLPAVTGIDAKILSVAHGTEAILDGNQGELRLMPSAEEKRSTLEKQKILAERREAALLHATEKAQTLDGHKVSVMANIGGVADAKMAVELGCDGIGLLRSEFLFLDRTQSPTEDEQFQVYQEIATLLDGRPFTIRTLDVGGDKPLKYLPMPEEENPFLGERGIRIGLRHPEILREQLRAILRVKSRGEIHIMFPMIAMLEEFLEVKAIFEEEKAKFNPGPIQLGIMIEVPSAALMAEELAKVADFFSIGTNDLSQYTLAIDRGHKTLAKHVDGLHPSVLRLIEMSVKAAHKYNKWVGVCGGIAGDPQAVPILVGLGIDELSVSLPTIPLVKSQVREISLKDCEKIAGLSLKSTTAKEVRSLEKN